MKRLTKKEKEKFGELLFEYTQSDQFKTSINKLIREHSENVIEDCYTLCVSIEGGEGKCSKALKDMKEGL